MSEPLAEGSRREAQSTKHINRRGFINLTAGAATLAVAGRKSKGTEPGRLARLTISEASKKIYAGEITSTELTRSCIERAGLYNTKVNAI